MSIPMDPALRTFVLLVVLGAGCAAPRTVSRGSPLVGRAVEVAAPDLAGREVRLAPGGARVTVIDFWATWCEPCREQLPALDRLAARYRTRGVAVYAVSFDEDRRAIDAFVAHTPVSLPVLWDGGGARLAERLGVTRLPTTLVLDAAGVVRAVHVGFDGSADAALDSEVRRLLGG